MKENKRITRNNTLIQNLLDSTPPLEKMQIKERLAIACRIYDQIQLKGFSLSQFATKLQKNPSEISKWVSGTHNFTINTLVEIANALGITLGELLDTTPKHELEFVVTKVM